MRYAKLRKNNNRITVPYEEDNSPIEDLVMNGWVLVEDHEAPPEDPTEAEDD